MRDLQADFSKAEIDKAHSTIADRLEVKGVQSIWAPIIENDLYSGSLMAEDLLHHLEADTGVIDSELQTMKYFGAAVGSLALRRLFCPFVADEIKVIYREGSRLDQHNAIHRLTKGI